MDLRYYEGKGKIIDIEKGDQGYELIFEKGNKTIITVVCVESFASFTHKLGLNDIELSDYALMKIEKIISEGITTSSESL